MHCYLPQLATLYRRKTPAAADAIALKNGVKKVITLLVIVELGVKQALLYGVSALCVDGCDPYYVE